MLPHIQEQFERLERKHKAFIDHIASLSDEVQSFKAGPDKWSVVEVVEHLVLVEKDLLTQLTANVPASTLDPGLKTPEKHQRVIKVMQGDIPVEVPDESGQPRGRLTLDALLSQWADIRQKLRGLLEEITAGIQNDPVYRHPYGGPLEIADALEFVEVYVDNHLRHVDRIVAQTL
jgi:hypothetical protein